VIVGGTSLGAPSWAALIALVNQGRAGDGQPVLNTASPTETQQALYSLGQSDYHEIASGTNGGYNAAPGYNLVTGLGTPVANLLVPDMVRGNYPATGRVARISPDLNANPGWTGSGGGTFDVMQGFVATNGTTAPSRNGLIPADSGAIRVTSELADAVSPVSSDSRSCDLGELDAREVIGQPGARWAPLGSDRSLASPLTSEPSVWPTLSDVIATLQRTDAAGDFLFSGDQPMRSDEDSWSDQWFGDLDEYQGALQTVLNEL